MKLAFVTPRYGAGILGGSEARVRDEARGLAARGHAVEVLTTCARDGDTWQNEWPEGIERDGEVTVRRFATVPAGDAARRDELDHLVLSGRPLGAAEEGEWIDSRYEAPGLARHIATAAGGYDALVYSPYPAWTTLRCLPIAPERAVLMACLHDEPAARLQSVRAVLAGAAEVWFQSEPEHQLGHRLAPLGRHRTVGSAVHVPERYDPDGARARFGVDRPFVLYAGRREDGKGWPEALRGFARAIDREGLDLRLVTIGTGDTWVPARLADRVVHLGFVDEADVPGVFAAALAYLQPSRNESFSRTIMESWLAGTVVVASAASEVVGWHCERSGGGLVYGDEIGLAACLRAVVDHPEAAAELAAAGRRYVLEHYTWPAALDTIEAALEELVSHRQRSSGGPAPGAPVGAGDLEASVRARAAGERASFSGDQPATAPALSQWLPRPGLGVPAWATPPAAPPQGSRAQGAPGSNGRRVLGPLLVAADRHPLTRRLAGAARAALRAWSGETGSQGRLR